MMRSENKCRINFVDDLGPRILTLKCVAKGNEGNPGILVKGRCSPAKSGETGDADVRVEIFRLEVAVKNRPFQSQLK